MQPTQILPENYVLAWSLDLKHNTRLNIVLQVVGLVWTGLSAWLLTGCVIWQRPGFGEMLKQGASITLPGALLLLAIMAVAIILHELVHGLFFWVFARHLPEFGIGPGYAFAAMPDWFYPKYKYLAIALAPLIFITCLGLLASAFAPLSWLWVVLAGMIINAGGAIGDMYVGWRIAREAGDVWIKDTGDGFQLYRRQVE